MCGIAGAIDLTGAREFPERRLLSMTGAIWRRGPDDEQTYQEPGLALGVRRLSVVDLEGGRQPIANESGTVWVAYNGELYEYPELRRGLLAAGHTLATRCDTEAWVHLYEDHGEAMFAKARGDFAVALWDRPNRRLILGRDRIGVCPLYYAERDGWLLFGSEVKALLASGLVAAAPDPRGVDYFFHFFCAGTTRTFFAGVKSLPPGHYLRIQSGRVELRKYWDLDFPDAGAERRLKDPAPLVEELEGVLTQAVERRLTGDVPVVSYISGGLDSTMMLGTTKRLLGEAVPSFTIGLDKVGPDERSKARESAAVLGSRLTTVTMTRSDIVAAYPELITAAEGPVFDTSCACSMKLAAAVHEQGYKVVMTGEGADEALAGYMWFKTQKLRLALRSVIGQRPLEFVRGRMLKSQRPVNGIIPWTDLRAMADTRPAQQDLYELMSCSRSAFYSAALWDTLDGHNAYHDLDLTNDRITRWHPLNQSIYVAYRVMLAGLLMVAKGDRVARNSSVEARFPFLDDDVTAFCASIAPEYKLGGFTDKWLLRRLAARVLPPPIAHRRKTMFRAGLAETFLGPGHPPWVDQLLSPESLRATGWFDVDSVAAKRVRLNQMSRLSPRRFVYDAGLTCVVTTQLWHHIFCGGNLCELPAWTPPGPAARLPEALASTS
jgi:asparagine synthase (glutamine-hydrolysing)